MGETAAATGPGTVGSMRRILIRFQVSYSFIRVPTINTGFVPISAKRYIRTRPETVFNETGEPSGKGLTGIAHKVVP